MKTTKILSLSAVIALILLLSLNFVTPLAPKALSQEKQPSSKQDTIKDALPPWQDNMTFTSGKTINLTTGIQFSFSSGFNIFFTTGIYIQFIVPIGVNYIEPCTNFTLVAGKQPLPCEWWEILDPLGRPTGFEFHVDWSNPTNFHVDQVYPDPFPVQPGSIVKAEKKIDSIEWCDNFVVYDPPEWGPPVCSWWEVIWPPEWAGIEFHVDWSNASCEFHVDEVIGHSMPLWPWPYYVEAERKVESIEPCDNFKTSPETLPEPCSWWEIIYPKEAAGYEFHVDSNNGMDIFHVDTVTPGNLTFPVPTPRVYAEKKITELVTCTNLYYISDSMTPVACDWYEIVYPPSLKGVEFHVDSVQGPYIHIDTVYPHPITGFAVYKIVAERKIPTINTCDWFTIGDPTSWVPDVCSWWKIIAPQEWVGVTFHVDSTDGVNSFHIDKVDQVPVPGTPPPFKVAAEPYTPPGPYFKPSYSDYAISGMPDFDQKQDAWIHGLIGWSHCGPVATANSLWWLDSEYESIYNPLPVPPPTISDHFPLVTSYNPGVWDDHDPRNMEGLVNNLAFLMDTNGMRTQNPATAHTGTYVTDAETGISQYLQQQGINPMGDCDGDGDVDGDDMNIIYAAWYTSPGSLLWDMRADIFIDNVVNEMDRDLALANLGQVGMFYEHTVDFPMFPWIEEEIKRCEDVVLNLEWWNEVAPGVWQKWEYDPTGQGGHYVTCAGVDSEAFTLWISDPWWDAAEAGFPGRIPIPHPPGHLPSLHNNTAFVSQDSYGVALWAGVIPPPGYVMPFWELVGYLQEQDFGPTWHAFIRAAVVTSPIRDVAVTSVTTTKDGCLPVPTVGEGMPVTINVVVDNQGGYPETFTVRIYANLLQIASQIVSLMPKTLTTVTYVWTPTGIAHITYTITGSADSVPGETDLGDNSLGGGTLQVVVPGNINGDGAVDSTDLGMMGGAWGAFIGDPNWNPNADLDDNGVIDSTDLGIMGGHWGEFEP